MSTCQRVFLIYILQERAGRCQQLLFLLFLPCSLAAIDLILSLGIVEATCRSIWAFFTAKVVMRGHPFHGLFRGRDSFLRYLQPMFVLQESSWQYARFKKNYLMYRVYFWEIKSGDHVQWHYSSVLWCNSGSLRRRLWAVGMTILPDELAAGKRFFRNGRRHVAGGLGVIIPPIHSIIMRDGDGESGQWSLFLAGIVLWNILRSVQLPILRICCHCRHGEDREKIQAKMDNKAKDSLTFKESI